MLIDLHVEDDLEFLRRLTTKKGMLRNFDSSAYAMTFHGTSYPLRPLGKAIEALYASTEWTLERLHRRRFRRERGDTMAVKIREKNGKWWLFVDWHGQRKKKCIGTKEAAEKARIMLEARLVLGAQT